MYLYTFFVGLCRPAATGFLREGGCCASRDGVATRPAESGYGGLSTTTAVTVDGAPFRDFARILHFHLANCASRRCARRAPRTVTARCTAVLRGGHFQHGRQKARLVCSPILTSLYRLFDRMWPDCTRFLGQGKQIPRKSLNFFRSRWPIFLSRKLP